MSNALTIIKAQAVGKALRRTFDDAPQLEITVRCSGEDEIKLTATYTGSEEHQVAVGSPVYEVTAPTKGLTPGALYAQLLHPLDHWNDVVTEADRLTQEGLL